MTELEVFIALASIHLVAVIIPGPDFTLVARYSLVYGRRTALPAACGIGSGILVHILYSIVGLGILIATHPLIFNIFKMIGAAYLFFIAYQSWSRSKRQQTTETIEARANPSYTEAFRTGFLTNALNIKASMFFFTLFILLIDNSPLVLQILYGIYMAVATALYFAILTWLFSSLHPLLQNHSRIIERASAIIIGLFAVVIVFAAKPPF